MKGVVLGIVLGLSLSAAIIAPLWFGGVISPRVSPPTNAHPVWVTNVNGTKIWSD